MDELRIVDAEQLRSFAAARDAFDSKLGWIDSRLPPQPAQRAREVLERDSDEVARQTRSPEVGERQTGVAVLRVQRRQARRGKTALGSAEDEDPRTSRSGPRRTEELSDE
ncbi:MAG TPA: hypothetical protein VFK71_02395, partial [Gaiellaceae bacterium]|nr:hypothetical protein [Gaiellaceae bacterium]